MALFGIKIKKKERAGLFLDRGIFRYIVITGDSGGYTVTKSVAGTIPDNLSQDGEPFANNGMYLYQLLDDVESKVGVFDVPVHIALPTTDSLLRIVSMPGMAPAEAKMAFRYDFENYFPFHVDEAIFDLAEITYPLQNGAEEKRFLVAAARMNLIDNITRAAAAHSMELTAIEPAQIALERAVSPAVAVCDAAVYIYAGRTRSVMVLSWKGSGVFYRSMTLGFGDGSPAASAEEQEQLRADSIAFAREVRSSLQFAISQIRGFEPEAVFLFGPGATPGLCDMLKDVISVSSIMLTDPASVHGIEFDASAGAWEIPLGLALR